MPSLEDQLQKAWQYLQGSQFAAAIDILNTILQRTPTQPYALCLLGMARLNTGDTPGAVPLLERAIQFDARNGMALDSLGLAYLQLERFADAVNVLRRAAAIPNAPGVVDMRLGLALWNLNDLPAAADALTRALNKEPTNIDCRMKLGAVLQQAGNAAAAREQYLAVLRLVPNDAGATGAVGAVGGLAECCLELGRLSEAIPHLMVLAKAEPDNLPLMYSLASALFETGRLGEAEQWAKRYVALDNNTPHVLLLLANTLFIQGKLDEGMALLEDACARADDGELLGLLTFQYRQNCDWGKWRTAWGKLAPLVDTGVALGSPFWLLCEPVSAEQQLNYTKAWAQRRYDGIKALPAISKRVLQPGQRIRIGYLSSDFQEHAAAYLIADVIEHHNREQFEVFAYSYGPPHDTSPMRQRLLLAFEHFVDISRDTDDDAAARIRNDGIDILIEIKGYTIGDRITIMARRPCPVQATWLGYPGTLGASFVDYLIADAAIIRPGEEASCVEQVIRMPHCYQPNDRKRTIAQPLSRADYGLPERGVVYCCFNQTYKITPDVFEVWLHVLQRVPDSVLWLVDSGTRARDNVLAVAQAAGVAAHRIIFAPRKPYAEHLARYTVADIALDTTPYTSHTTMSDALWCGCPVVGLSDAQNNLFAARVSGSILTAAGFPELITDTLAAYAQLAYELALNPARLNDLRARLQHAKTRAPMFDTAAFAHDLEQLYSSLLVR